MFIGRDLSSSRNYSEKVASKIDEEIHSIISNSYDKTEEILKENMEKLHKVAQYLFKNEKMSGEEFTKIVEGRYEEIAAEESKEKDSETQS